MMKRIFIKTFVLVLLALILCYLMISEKTDGGSINVMESAADTGLSIISMLFIFPSFVFTILSMTVTDKKIVEFIGNTFCSFCGVFSLVSGIIALFDFTYKLYVPIVLIVFSLVVSIISIIGLIKQLKEEKKEENVSNS